MTRYRLGIICTSWFKHVFAVWWLRNLKLYHKYGIEIQEDELWATKSLQIEQVLLLVVLYSCRKFIHSIRKRMMIYKLYIFNIWLLYDKKQRDCHGHWWANSRLEIYAKYCKELRTKKLTKKILFVAFQNGLFELNISKYTSLSVWYTWFMREKPYQANDLGSSLLLWEGWNPLIPILRKKWRQAS